jgi:hypothetical protein
LTGSNATPCWSPSWQHLGISRAVEALVAVEHELGALAVERRATRQAASDAARGFEALRVELASVKTQLADVVAVLRTFRR